jgi:anthranilate synthase/aminodeoxychorismate synthase-like glutamine amidotransferase
MNESIKPPSSFSGLEVLIIDNYDSFTFNLVQYLQILGLKTKTIRNDEWSCETILNYKPKAVVLSPGPSTPDHAGVCLDWIKTNQISNIPTLGICLGHQSIGQAFGAKVSRCNIAMHGKVSDIFHNSMGLFKSLSNPFSATRYHSLQVDPSTLPDVLEVTAWSSDGTIMGLRHKDFAIEGLQFHPESILTKDGLKILENFFQHYFDS